MYLRFRFLKPLTVKSSNNAFAELHEHIHGHPPKEAKVTNQPLVSRVQINLVANRRVDGKPRQIHLKTIARLNLYDGIGIDEIVDEKLLLLMRQKLRVCGAPTDVENKLIEKIKLFCWKMLDKKANPC